MSKETESLDLSHLEDDGDTVKLDDGRTLRLRIEVDQDTNVMEEEFFGEFAWCDRLDRRHMNDYGTPAPRPDGFDGNAEKLSTSHGDRYWWQPPRGDYEMTAKRGSDEFNSFRQLVMDLVEWGYKGVVLELCDGADAYGRPVVSAVASLWGIDSLEDGYLAEVVKDLAAELPI
jgi:hypothetical protein